MTDIAKLAKLANDFAALDAQIKELTKARLAVKELLLEKAIYSPNKKGVNEFVVSTNLVDVVFTETYPTTFSKDLAETLLSSEDFQRCHATAIKPTITPRIVYKSTALA